jgi:hypothetical protein
MCQQVHIFFRYALTLIVDAVFFQKTISERIVCAVLDYHLIEFPSKSNPSIILDIPLDN